MLARFPVPTCRCIAYCVGSALAPERPHTARHPPLSDMYMRRMQETAIARVSDDFYPRNSASSHPHIAACAFNGFFMSAILHVRAFSPSAACSSQQTQPALPDVMQ